MKVHFSIVITVLLSLQMKGQELYRVYFTDKDENLELLGQPYKFLSPKAIERRAEHHIPIDQFDLPVCKSYLKAINLKAIRVSKWFNYVLVKAFDHQIEELKQLPFVKKIDLVKPHQKYFTNQGTGDTAASANYGLATNQIEMVKGQVLHKNDYLGQAMTIAVLDGGFSGVESLAAFDSLWLNNRILGSYDFVQNDTDVFDQGNHGTRVLSVLGGYIENGLAGSAPKAFYWLLKSEDESREIVAEMDNWAAAAEFADSVGADVINSSLGYYAFDGGIGNYQYSDFDGNTTVVTKAADKAAQKGILVVNGAGNGGNNSWGRIWAPADGDSILTVGAVDPNGNYISFSGTGPTADGRIKPDIVAQGSGTIIVGSGNQAVPASGTSYSCPIISGLATCLWQVNPSMSNMDIYYAIRNSAHQRLYPDNLMGFGIPNFEMALYTVSEKEEVSSIIQFDIYPIPFEREVYIKPNGFSTDLEVELSLFDMKGIQVYRSRVTLSSKTAQKLPLPNQAGTYILSIKMSGLVYLEKIVK